MMNTDFEKTDNLLRTKDFETLTAKEREYILHQMTETEYTSMHELYKNVTPTNYDEINPSPALKGKLDNVLKLHKKPIPVIGFRLPLYQVAAIALIFLIIGIGLNYKQDVPVRIVTQKIREIKYINRPVEKIRYVVVPVRYAHKSQVSEQPETIKSADENDAPTAGYKPETNPEIYRQQEIAMTNILHVINENNGVSLGSDTVLQKMMVPAY